MWRKRLCVWFVHVLGRVIFIIIFIIFYSYRGTGWGTKLLGELLEASGLKKIWSSGGESRACKTLSCLRRAANC